MSSALLVGNRRDLFKSQALHALLIGTIKYARQISHQFQKMMSTWRLRIAWYLLHVTGLLPHSHGRHAMPSGELITQRKDVVRCTVFIRTTRAAGSSRCFSIRQYFTIAFLLVLVAFLADVRLGLCNRKLLGASD